MNLTPLRTADRLRILQPAQRVAGSSFAQDVAAGLLAKPRRLAPKYFYDDLGSALFEAITRLPEYYLTGAETVILREYGWEMVRMLRGTFDMVELGSGSAIKTRILIEEALRVQRTLHYCPIDISPDALSQSAQALVSAYPQLTVTAYAADYFSILASDELEVRHPVLALLLGSNLGNYEPAQQVRLVSAIAASLKSGDGLLLGADLRKDRATLELAYDDPTGVTAAFDKNLLGRINRELDGDFDLTKFRHVVHYDEQRGVVESFLESTEQQTASIGKLKISVCFAPGERIHTESSYKFSIEGLGALAAAAGLALKRTWYDPQRRYSVNFFQKP